MSLSAEKIEQNKQRMIELVSSINRQNFNKEGFLTMLESSNFYISPASTKYHNDFKGGLCDHCLKVYDAILKLVQIYDIVINDPDSLLIVALFHDLGKINLYTLGTRNVKHYCTEEEFNADPKGYKAYDEIGNFKWVAEQYWTTRDTSERFIFGNHEETCEYIASQYIPLRREESVAILHHMGGQGFDSADVDLFSIYRAYPLAFLLFQADFAATILYEDVE